MRWTWHHWALAGLVLCAGLGATQLAARACTFASTRPPEVLGLRLGMTPDDVRARFASTAFRTELGEDVALIADGPLTPEVPTARFEFHEGQLVAVRLRVASEAPAASGPDRELSPQIVLARTHEADGSTSVVLLSRTCPTHREEAMHLAGNETSALP